MIRINKKQTVKLFKDANLKSKQNVVVELNDGDEPWIVVEHDHIEISLSITNWEKLVELSKIAIEESKKL